MGSKPWPCTCCSAVTEQAGRGHERSAADALAARVAVEGTFHDGPHGLGVAAELVVGAGVVRCVPCFDGRKRVLLDTLFHAHPVAQLFERVGAVQELAGRVVAFFARRCGGFHVAFDGGLGLIVPLLGGKMAGQLVEEHGLPVSVPDDVGPVARLARPGASRQQGTAERLVAVALAVLVEPEALDAFHGRQGDERVAAHIAAGADLHLRADAHPHGDAAAVASRHGGAVGILAQLVVLAADGVVHGRVRSDVAARQHYGFAVVLDVVAVSILRNDAGHLGAILVVHQAHGRLSIVERGARFLRLCLAALESVGHADASGELARAHVRGEQSFLVVVAIDDGPVQRNELVFLFFGVAVDEPVERLAGAVSELAQQRGLHAPGAVDLVLVHEFDGVV